MPVINSGRTYAVPGGGGGGNPPIGVTLQDIDGGANFYASRGLTTAVGLGFDNPNYIQMAPDATGLLGAPNNEATTIATLQDLNLTSMTRIQGGSNTDTSLLPALAAAGIYGFPQPTFNGAAPYADIAQPNVNTPGFQQDEPNALADILAWEANIPNAIGDPRVYAVNFNWITAMTFGQWDVVTNMGNLFPGGTQAKVTTPSSAQRFILDQVSLDQYWFQVATGNAFGQSTQQGFGPGMYQAEPAGSTPGFVPGWFTGSSNMPPDVIGRAARHGDLIDALRQWSTGNLGQAADGFPYRWGRTRNTSPAGPIPIFAFIEASYAFTQSAFQNTNSITPPQLNASIWMAFIHGARGVYLFTHANFPNGDQVDNVLNYAPYQTPLAGQSISNYAQVKATGLLVKQLAPVINSKTALGYATVTPAASVWAGFDVISKWYQGGNVTNQGLALVNGGYVFAAYRGSQLDTNISATFHVLGSASFANVVGESRSIQIIGGAFTDTFANGNTVHIYQIS